MVEKLTIGPNSSLNGEITLDQVAHLKDETVRFLEKRSFNLLSFTYSYEPDRALELNTTLENDLDNLLLNTHKQLAYHRLYADNKSNVSVYNSQLKRLETLTKEVESCYERFQNVKKNNPDPKTIAIIHIFGVDDLEKRVKESLNQLDILKKTYENLQEDCKNLLENLVHFRRMLSNLKDQAQVIFYKQVKVASLIDEVAMYKGVYLKDPVADKVHKACLSQSASELSVDSWALRIKYCKDTLQNIKAEADKANSNSTPEVLNKEKEKEFYESISNNIVERSKCFIVRTARRKEMTVTPAKLRIQREIGQLTLPEGVDIRFPDLNDIMSIQILITPREGIWEGMTVRFSCRVPEGYPHDRLRIKCISKILHPNILGINSEKCQGAVCLNIIREDWLPIYTLNTAIIGLLNLLLEPQHEEPLDQFSADLLINDPQQLRLLNLNLFSD